MQVKNSEANTGLYLSTIHQLRTAYSEQLTANRLRHASGPVLLPNRVRYMDK